VKLCFGTFDCIWHQKSVELINAQVHLITVYEVSQKIVFSDLKVSLCSVI